MSKQALFDFDGTITSKDTTVSLLLALLKLRPWRSIGLIWFLLRMLMASDSVSKQRQKNRAIGYLIKDLSEMRLVRALMDFRKKVEFFYRPSVIAAVDQATQEGCTVLVVTASPSFAISNCLRDFPVTVIGTEFETKENIYTGLLKSKNCYGQEKVNRIYEWAISNKISLSVEYAWSDHYSDLDMLNLSAERYWIGGEQLQKQVMVLDPKATFVHARHSAD